MSEMDLHSDDEAQDPEPSEESEMDIETPEADVVEQHTPVRDGWNGSNGTVPLETNEADAPGGRARRGRLPLDPRHGRGVRVMRSSSSRGWNRQACLRQAP